MTKLTYSDIPHDWAICYQSDCPLSAQCLRHHAALLAPANLLHHDVVLPAARHDDDCQAFVPNDLLAEYKEKTEALFGEGSCYVLAIRPVGGCEV